MLPRKLIIKKSIQIGILTQISRFLGVARELIMIQYLGVGVISDAFITAFKVPNALRKIFAEGALSAVLVPSIVKELQKGSNERLNRFMTGAFLLFETLCLLFVFCGMYYAQPLIHCIAPGFDQFQQTTAARFLVLLLPFIFFVSVSSLFAGALHAKGKFTIPAVGPAFLNVVFLFGLGVCIYFKLPVSTYCLFIIAGGILQSLLHLGAYMYHGFSFAWCDREAVCAIKGMLRNFVLCLPSVSFSEINLFIDTTFASLLDQGTISLLYYANRFMGIPLGVIIGSLTMVLLPQFTHVALRSKKRLSFYVTESINVIIWITLPITLMMICSAYHLFYTLFLSESFTVQHVEMASRVLRGFCIGLPFLALNRLLLNVLYAMQKTAAPAFISAIAVGVNIGANILFMQLYGAVGLACATSLSAAIQMLLFVSILYYYECRISLKRCGVFLLKYVLQLCIVGVPLLLLYTAVRSFLCFDFLRVFMRGRFDFWMFAVPLYAIYMLTLWVLRKRAGLYLFFID